MGGGRAAPTRARTAAPRRACCRHQHGARAHTPACMHCGAPQHTRLFVDRSRRQQPVHRARLRLSVAPHARHRLQVMRGVPVYERVEGRGAAARACVRAGGSVRACAACDLHATPCVRLGATATATRTHTHTHTHTYTHTRHKRHTHPESSITSRLTPMRSRPCRHTHTQIHTHTHALSHTHTHAHAHAHAARTHPSPGARADSRR